MKICLGLLSNRGFKGKTVLALLKMVEASSEHEFTFAFIDSGYTIAENRNYLAAQAVKNDCDYLLMVDDDMLFPPETLKVLLSREKDIIGVPYNVKALPKSTDERQRHNVTYFPEEPLHPNQVKVEKPLDEPEEVLAIGSGVMLVNVDVFRKLSQPHFTFEMYENGMTKVGEDSCFCYKAAKEGYKIWCERSLKDLGHIGDYIY